MDLWKETYVRGTFSLPEKTGPQAIVKILRDRLTEPYTPA